MSAAPIWLDDPASLLPALVAAGLLSDDGKLPVKTWNSWFKPALTRRRNRQRSGSEGGKQKASNARATLEHRYSDASDTGKQRYSDALPDPSTPSVPSIPTVRPLGGASLEETTTTANETMARLGERFGKPRRLAS